MIALKSTGRPTGRPRLHPVPGDQYRLSTNGWTITIIEVDATANEVCGRYLTGPAVHTEVALTMKFLLSYGDLCYRRLKG